MSEPSPLAPVRQNAQTLRDQGDAEAARQMLAQALESARPGLGTDHPEVLATTLALARLHRHAGDPAAARRILEEAIAAGQRRLGDADPLMLTMSYDLGMVAEELGNRHEARRNFGRIAQHGPAVLGTDHSIVQDARSYLGTNDTGTPAPQRLADTHTTPRPGPTRLPAYPAPPPSVPPLGPAPAPGRASRRGLLVAVLAVTLPAAIAVGVVMLRTDKERPAEPPAAMPSPTATLTGEPPADVKLHANGSTVTLTWTDPTDGAVSFVVSGGRAGEDLRKVAEVNRGDTRFRITGLNASRDYCFTVSAVYSPDRSGVSEKVCTARAASSR